MRLADFIEQNTSSIVDDAERFGRTLLPAASHLDSVALRDHIPVILATIVADLRTPQTSQQELAKSEGSADSLGPAPTAAETHAVLRARSAFDIRQLAAEYRALRASVLRLWLKGPSDVGDDELADLMRFNEAIDQALAESVTAFSAEAEKWRNVFLAVLGHDLRGPLNSVLLTAEVLATFRTDAPVSDYIQRLIANGRRMQELLDNLLDFNRSTLGFGVTVDRRYLDLAEICREEVEVVRSALPDRLIVLEVSGRTTGDFDGSRVREALGNLLFNAAKYGSAQSSIIVSVVGSEERACLSVTNSGPPIPPEVLPTLFEPLRRGLPSPSGMPDRSNLGLGLFIVNEIAKAHGGSVDAESKNGLTTFRLNLPRVAAGPTIFGDRG